MKSDPELYTDEVIFLRTQGIYVKSIPFEGILTNERIILIDRVKNLLPKGEISLDTIKDIVAGENAIRDQIITLSVFAKTGETRQIILTFSRQTGGTRIKERNEWLRLLKENTSPSFEQPIPRVVIAHELTPKKPERITPPRIEVINPSILKNVPSARKTTEKKEVESSSLTKRILESSPIAVPSSTVEKEYEVVSDFSTYCSRCGNLTPEGSRFCNLCGSQIIVPDSVVASQTPQAELIQPGNLNTASDNIQSSVTKKVPIAQLIENSTYSIPSDRLGAVLPKQEIPLEQISAVPSQEAIPLRADSCTITETEEKPGLSRPDFTNSPHSKSMIPDDQLPILKKSRYDFSFESHKHVIIGSIMAFLTVIIYLFLVALNMSIIFIIGLNALLVFIELISVTKYCPKFVPFLNYATVTGIILFLYLTIQNFNELL